jgi:hypothetical protein
MVLSAAANDAVLKIAVTRHGHGPAKKAHQLRKRGLGQPYHGLTYSVSLTELGSGFSFTGHLGSLLASRSGSLAKLMAMRRTSSRVVPFIAARRLSSSSP